MRAVSVSISYNVFWATIWSIILAPTLETIVSIHKSGVNAVSPAVLSTGEMNVDGRDDGLPERKHDDNNNNASFAHLQNVSMC